jgi:4-hydroxybenzoate polyprenyltransferase
VPNNSILRFFILTLKSKPLGAIKSFLKLVRWKNLAIVAATQYMVRVFLIFDNPFLWTQDWRFHLMVLTTILIAAAGYIINDYFDVKIDRINKPQKVYIGKTISRRAAQLSHQLFSGLAIVLAVLVGWKAVLINIFSVTLLWFYASGFKKKPFIGNFVVSLLTSLVIAEVAIIFSPENRLIYMYAVFAFFINLIREIIKDMEDMKGDEMHGAKTLPILFGVHKTKQLLYVLMGVFLTSMFFFMYKVEDLKIRIFSIFLLALWATLLVFIIRSDRKKHFSQLSNLCKGIILVGMVSIVLFKFG